MQDLPCSALVRSGWLLPLGRSACGLPVSAPERALLDLLSETGSVESLPLLDELPGHLTRSKHSRRLGGGGRWVDAGRPGERLDLAATPSMATTPGKPRSPSVA